MSFLALDSTVVRTIAALREVDLPRALETARALSGQLPDDVASVLCSKVDPPCRVGLAAAMSMAYQ